MGKGKPSQLDTDWTNLFSLIKQNTVYANSVGAKDMYQFAYTKWTKEIDDKYLYAITYSTQKSLIDFCNFLNKKSQFKQFELNQIIHVVLDEVSDLMITNKKPKLQKLLKRLNEEKENKKTYIFAIAKANIEFEGIWKISEDIKIGKIDNLIQIFEKDNVDDYVFKDYSDLFKSNDLFIAVNVYGEEDYVNLTKAINKGKRVVNFFNYFAYYFQGYVEPMHLITDLSRPYYSNRFDYFIKYGEGNWKGSINSINKQNLGFVNINQKLVDKVRNLLNRSRENIFGADLEQAVNWLGKSLSEDNYNDRLLDVMIAFECIAERKNKDISIVDQLVNFVSYVLSTSNKNALKKSVSKIYDLRSEIAHNGFDETKENEYWTLFDLLNMLINELLTNKSYKNMDVWIRANKS